MRLPLPPLLLIIITVGLIYLPAAIINAEPSIDREHFEITPKGIQLLESMLLEIEEYKYKIERIHYDEDSRDYQSAVHGISRSKQIIDDVISGKVSPASTQHTLKHRCGNRIDRDRWCGKLIRLMESLRPQVTVTLPMPMPMPISNVSIPVKKIQNILITTTNSVRFSTHTLSYQLTNQGDYFRTNKGKRLPRQTIDDLQNSLADLRLWEQEVGCAGSLKVTHSNVYHKYVIEFQFENSDDVLRISQLYNCPSIDKYHVPLNVIWHNNVYLSFNRVAIHNFFKLIDESTDRKNTVYSLATDVIPVLRKDFLGWLQLVPLTEKDSVFSMTQASIESMQQTAYRSPVLEPYWVNHEISKIWPTCMLTASNYMCDDLTLEITIKDKKQDVSIGMYVLLRDNQIVQFVENPSIQMQKYFERILNQPIN